MSAAADPAPQHPALQKGRVAVITGAASGIGFAASKRCAELGMRVVLADVNAARLESAVAELRQGLREECGVALLAVPTDVRDPSQMEALREKAVGTFGSCHFLFLNAGISGGGGPIPSDLNRWRTVMEVNLFGVLHGLTAFVKPMIKQSRDDGVDCVVAITGSLAGITTPPGDTSYNVGKAGVRVLTEGLEHQLRSTPGCRVRAALLLPGMTDTGIGVNSAEQLYGESAAQMLRERAKSQPGETIMGWNAVQPDQHVKALFEAIDAGTFYVIGTDGEMSKEAFGEAVRWSADDVAKQRPPLSRWHPDFKTEYLAKLAKL